MTTVTFERIVSYMTNPNTIKIVLDPNYPFSLTPAIVGDAVQAALAFGTDDTLNYYEGADALSQPLLDHDGTAFGFVNIGNPFNRQPGELYPVTTADGNTEWKRMPVR